MHGLEDDVVQVAFQCGPADGGRRLGIAVADFAVQFGQVVTGEAMGPLAGEDFIQDCTQRIDVGAPLRETLLFPLTTPSAAYAAEFPGCRRSCGRACGAMGRESRQPGAPPDRDSPWPPQGRTNSAPRPPRRKHPDPIRSHSDTVPKCASWAGPTPPAGPA